MPIFAQLFARLDDGVMRRAVGENTDGVLTFVGNWLRNRGARRVVLAHETIEITLPHVGQL